MSDDHGQEGGANRARATQLRLALGMAAFGSATPVSKIVTEAMPVFVGGGLRVLLGAATLVPFLWRGELRLSDVGRADWGRIALISLFGMFGFTAFMLYGMRMASGVVGATVMSTTPAVTAVASIVFFREAITWRKAIAVLLAVVGVLILQIDQSGGAAGQGSSHLLGAILVFCAVCCEAVYTLLGKKVGESVPPVAVAGLSAVLSLPLFAALAFWQWPGFDPGKITPGAWIAVVWYGCGTLALGSWLWYSGIAKAEGSVAAAFMGVMPASALVLSYLLLGEPFRAFHLLGFSVVFAGVLLMSWEHARMARSSG